jgi:uncharacterized protein YheU (UPF0270 family)
MPGSNQPPPAVEEGTVVPYQRLDPATLRRLIQEVVTRNGADWAEPGCSLEAKVEQVLRQLRDGTVRIVFDAASATVNIVPGSR